MLGHKFCAFLILHCGLIIIYRTLKFSSEFFESDHMSVPKFRSIGLFINYVVANGRAEVWQESTAIDGA